MENIIVCDIQQQYLNYIHFNIMDFTKYLNKTNKDVLYFIVGNQTVGYETAQSVFDWLVKHGLKKSMYERISFIDKGYAFYRDYMEILNDESIINLIRYMYENRIHDTRDITDEKIIEDYMIDDDRVLTSPPFSLDDVKPYNNFELVGGGENECLAELKLYFDAHNLKYKINRRFVY